METARTNKREIFNVMFRLVVMYMQPIKHLHHSNTDSSWFNKRYWPGLIFSTIQVLSSIY